MKRNLLLMFLAAAMSVSERVWAEDTNATDDLILLRQQIQALDQKVRVLERQRELDQDASKEAAKETLKASPVFTAGPSGFSIRSADTNFVVAFHGLVQVDSRTFFDDGGIKANNGFLLRRARPILQGTVFRDFDFLFVPDFGGSGAPQIQDAYLNYRLIPELQLRAGKFKSPVGLEHLQADPATSFNERSLATDLVPNRDVGAELLGDLAGGTVSYAAGIFNGAPDYSGTTANVDSDDNKAFAGRVFLLPFKTTSLSALKGLGLGVGGSYQVDQQTNVASLTTGFTTDGQQRFFSYNTNTTAGFGLHWRIAPQGYYYWGPLNLMGEYVISDQRVINSKNDRAELQNTAWEINAGWVLTGEDASYSGVNPRHSFAPLRGQWGALQVVARYAELHVDDATFPNFANPATAASAAKGWAVGLNWYLNRNIRANASYSHTRFDGGNGAGSTVTKQPESVFFTRLQLAF
jgi:phosphate-selective porin OprO and OprP